MMILEVTVGVVLGSLLADIARAGIVSGLSRRQAKREQAAFDQFMAEMNEKIGPMPTGDVLPFSKNETEG